MRTDRNNVGSPVRLRQRGAVLVEFAFAWTIFFLVTLVGIMDLGRAIWAYNLLAHASHEGVRYAIVRGADSPTPATESDIRDYVRSRTTFLSPASVQVDVQWQPDNNPGSVVRVETQHTFDPLFAIFIPDIPLSSTAEMIIAQ